VRIWCAGCAGGEEAYSLAIALLEFLGDAAGDIPIQIFGTDLSEASIAKARAGLYPATIAADVSPERLRRFFVTDPGGYRIAKPVRDLCIFSRQNVLRDPPFSHLDLISCRNVLIYLQPALQRRVFPTFHYALEPHGMLILGSAESVGSASEHFEALLKRGGIYRRRPTITRPLDVDVATAPAPHLADPVRRESSRRRVIAPSTDEIEAEADRRVLAHFTPPGVVINEYMDVVQFRGDTSAFLAHAPGMASLVLLKLVRPELVVPLHTAIRKASLTGEPVREEGIVLADSDAGSVTLDVLPFRPPSTSARFFVISFTIGRPAVGEAAVMPADAASVRTSIAGRRRGRHEIQGFNALRDELAATKRYLEDIVQQHESTTEELRAANEEIQSSNEELQSANEELETTKEEIQSTNEELTTLNDELRYRNHELAALSDDLSNVLASTTIPIVIVGADLRLRRFTPATDRVMRVIASDLGRPLGDIKLRVALPDLERQITGVVQTLTLREQEVRDDEGRWWALTIRPYQTIDHLVDGAVLVFADIDASKRFGERAHEVAESRRQLLDVAEAGRAMADDARHMAEIANKAKTHFLASISHDLRTPLNAITGYTELLTLGLRGPVTEAQTLDLGRITRSARFLLALINDILTFAKMEAGHLDVRFADVPVAAVAAELHEIITPQLSAQSLRFERGDCDAMVRADPEKVRQILLNLLSNALQFTPRDGRIGIDYDTTDHAVRIEVWDTGRGIAREHIERIFDPFVQIDRGPATSTSGGVGLGLAISRSLARAMNGDLTVDSTLGAGSRFTLTLERV
jgi:two-component system CheB/CheR fusion protein